MSKELDRAKNLVARRPIPPAIRELLEPLAAAAPEDEKLEFDDLYGIVNVLLPLPKKKRGKKDAKDEPEQVRQEPEADRQEEENQES
mgnify:CR=1 FL=1|jgi:hypothetical protein